MNRDIIGASTWHVVACGKEEVEVRGASDRTDEEVLLTAVNDGIAGQTPGISQWRSIEGHWFPCGRCRCIDVEI